MPRIGQGHREDAGGGTKYLVRSGCDVLCHCDCEDAPVAFPRQADCPWCGCGWMFTCLRCRKAFVFARCVLRQETLEELAAADGRAFGCKPADESECVASWLDYMKPAMEGLMVGHEYIILDGTIYDVTDPGPFMYDGWYSHHELRWLPQVRARTDPAALGVLEDEDYWTSRELPDEPS